MCGRAHCFQYSLGIYRSTKTQSPLNCHTSDGKAQGSRERIRKEPFCELVCWGPQDESLRGQSCSSEVQNLPYMSEAIDLIPSTFTLTPKTLNLLEDTKCRTVHRNTFAKLLGPEVSLVLVYLGFTVFAYNLLGDRRQSKTSKYSKTQNFRSLIFWFQVSACLG